MARNPSRRRDHLHLVEPAGPMLPEIIADPIGRREVDQLTERLVEVLIEMMDIVDGDPDREEAEAPEDDDGV